MADNDQQTLTREQLAALFRALSKERIGTYLVAAGHDEARAMRLYIWNAKLGESFHIPIQAVEVALRNSVNGALVRQLGAEWWKGEPFQVLADHDRQTDIETVRRRIRNRKLPESIGQIVAGLSFGFWVGMLQPRYNPELWSKQLRDAFPNLPENRSRKSVATAVGQIAYLRNRISHHEPLIKRSATEDYKLLMDTLGWLCPHKLEWIRPHCRIPELARQKP